jgi:hypothetical protein
MKLPENLSQKSSTALLSAALYDKKHLCDIYSLLVIANAALTREHDGWEQAEGLFAAGARRRVKCLVPAQGARNKALDVVNAAFRATKSRGTPVSRAAWSSPSLRRPCEHRC